MASVTIRNVGDLTNILNAKISKALKETRNQIYKVVQEHITLYYKEPVFDGSCVPTVYDRQWKFLNSLIKTDLVSTTNGVSCSVEVNPLYIDYVYKGGATGLDVWNYADNFTHGGTVGGDMQVWKDSIDALGGKVGIENLMKANLRNVGIPIK